MLLPHQTLLDNLQGLEDLAREEGLAAPGNRLQRYHFLIKGLLAASQEPDPDAFPRNHGHARVMWALTEATELLGAAAVLRAYTPKERRVKLKAILAGPDSPGAERTTSNLSRNISFELNLAGRLSRHNHLVESAPDVDIKTRLNSGCYYFQCKRPYSSSHFRRNIKEAFAQLTANLDSDREAYGVIAFSVSRLVNPTGDAYVVPTLQHLAELDSWFARVMPQLNDLLPRLRHPRVLAAILHFTVPVFVREAVGAESIRTEQHSNAVSFFPPHVHQFTLLRSLIEALAHTP
jgi:hypothetical protein